MFIAMNRFKVILGREKAFEEMWLQRESHLHKRPGFVAFHLLRGPVREDYALYSSHTTWANKTRFEEWTKSEEFAAAHKNAHRGAAFMAGPAEFEGFEVAMSIYAPSETPSTETPGTEAAA